MRVRLGALNLLQTLAKCCPPPALFASLRTLLPDHCGATSLPLPPPPRPATLTPGTMQPLRTPPEEMLTLMALALSDPDPRVGSRRTRRARKEKRDVRKRGRGTHPRYIMVWVECNPRLRPRWPCCVLQVRAVAANTVQVVVVLAKPHLAIAKLVSAAVLDYCRGRGEGGGGSCIGLCSYQTLSSFLNTTFHTVGHFHSSSLSPYSPFLPFRASPALTRCCSPPRPMAFVPLSVAVGHVVRETHLSLLARDPAAPTPSATPDAYAFAQALRVGRRVRVGGLTGGLRTRPVDPICVRTISLAPIPKALLIVLFSRLACGGCAEKAPQS